MAQRLQKIASVPVLTPDLRVPITSPSGLPLGVLLATVTKTIVARLRAFSVVAGPVVPALMLTIVVHAVTVPQPHGPSMSPGPAATET